MKKILSMTLALVLMICTAATAYAQSGKITGMAQGLSLGYSAGSGSDYVDLGEVYSQDEHVEYIYLYDSMFTWDDGYVSATPTQLTPAQVRAAKLTARSSNSKVLDSVTVSAKDSRIEIKFKNTLTGTKEVNFDFEITLSIDGRRQGDASMHFSGVFTNPVIEIYADYDSVDISDGSIAEALEYVSNIELEIGDGVSIFTRLSKGKRVSATAIRTPDSADDELMKEHKEIRDVVNIKASGISSNAKIKLDGSYGKYYIYDGDLKYLGTTQEKLPYASKLYLADKELDMNDDEDVSEPVSSSTEAMSTAPTESAAANNVNYNPATGGGDYPPNANDNPGTGR